MDFKELEGYYRVILMVFYILEFAERLLFTGIFICLLLRDLFCNGWEDLEEFVRNRSSLLYISND